MDANGVIKVGDFGFSEDIYTSNYYQQKEKNTDVKLPVRWMPPESITDGVFTEKSDVVSAVTTLLRLHTDLCTMFKIVLGLLLPNWHFCRANSQNHTITVSPIVYLLICKHR